ncbi:extracellular calcium-sensing receptor-like [Ambystoma mexicanum]|uniref:extracellular calcium-sensing receptor-like n=1 Tax=Ambystoma mexicanum TaxID=8296 RepID=UPI0037E7789C
MRFRFQNYQWLQAIVFAIDEINRNPDFLPNVTLGLWMYDTCSAVSRALEGSIWILTQSGKSVPNYRCHRKAQLAGIIGDYSSTNTISMARLLGLSKYPQVSYLSTSSILSDRSQFPSFFRTIPSDDFQSRGLAQLVIHFGWTWVGLLAMDNDYGQQGILILRQELANAGVCIAFSENILTAVANKNALHIVRVIRSSSAKAIVIFSNEASLLPIVEEMVVQNVTGRTWIASESWSTFALLSIAKYQPVLSGTIGFAMRSGEIPGFNPDSVHPSKSPEHIFGVQLWEKAFDCKWPNQKNPVNSLNNTIKLCSGNDALENHQIRNNSTRASTAAYSAYGSVYAIASALKDLKSCETSRGPFHHGTCADITDFQPWQLLHYVQNVRFRNADGAEVSFDQHGNPPPSYDIVNWQRDAWGNTQYVKVGRYDSSAPQKLLVNTTAIMWAGGNTQIPLSLCSPICPPGFWKASKLGEPPCCFMCVPCPQGEMSNKSDSVTCSKCPWDQWPNERQDQCIPKTIEFLSYYEPLGAALAVISVGLSLIPSGILVMFIYFRKTPIVKANNRTLSYLLLFALCLCFLSSLFFIGFPSAETCLLRQAAFGIIFALCISCVLAKTMMVVIAFKAINPKSNLRRWVGRQLAYMVVTICTLIQVLLCVAWLSYLPTFSEYNTYSQPGNIIIECIEGSPVAFWCMLGYLGFLATISFIVAFLSRKLPDSFNEAKFITFSMLAFLVAWISFIPAYLSTRGKYMVAMEIFTILSSSSALVSCIFFPKCYIILLRPEMNIKEFLVDRGRGSTHVT